MGPSARLSGLKLAANLESGASLTMSLPLPGLNSSGPVETLASPTVYELKEGTEWRFEVAFDSKVEVKVRLGPHLQSKPSNFC